MITCIGRHTRPKTTFLELGNGPFWSLVTHTLVAQLHSLLLNKEWEDDLLHFSCGALDDAAQERVADAQPWKVPQESLTEL